MAKYPDKDEWIEEILIPDRTTPILGGQPVWEGDRLVDGFANVSAGQLANRTRHLKNKIEQIESDIDGDFSSFIRKEDNLSDLDDLQQAKYNLGLNLVDNTRDLDKPVSAPQQEALDGKVDLTDPRLSDSRTPKGPAGGVLSGSYPNPTFSVAMATQAELDAVADAKVDKVAGKQLSDENYTLAEKNKLGGIEAGAQVNTVTSVAGKTGAVTLNKTDVGLSNVDNTSDSNKPVSTAQQAALDLKLDADANAVSASKLATPRTISLSGDASGSTSFDGSSNVTIAVEVADDSHNHVISNVGGLQAALDSKVDKVAGKQLSDENYTLAEKNKLAGIQAGATANATNAQLRDRATHTGVQPISSVEGLQDALDEKVDDTDSRLTDAREWTAAVVSQAEAEAGTATTARKWTAQRVRQAVLGWWNTSTFKAKLDGIEAGATKNATDAQLRDRATHTGTQPISSITNLQSSLDSKVDKQAGYGLSQENYTPAEKSKLASLEGSKFKGEYVSLSALQAAHPSPEVGSYAYVDAGVGETVSKYIWDSSDSEWVKQQGETAALTPAEVKSLYEGNPDTNAFTDAEKTKLSGIQAGATANATNAQLRDRATHTGVQPISSVSGLQTALDNKADTTYVNTQLDSKVDKTISVVAGTGLSGGGTLSANRTLSVQYGTTAGTAAQGNDPRLSDSREWTAAVVTQDEAEAGAATTARKWTAQRVRQAIVAWFNGISGALGRTILSRTTAAQVRSDLELGSAALRNASSGTSSSDEDLARVKDVQYAYHSRFGDYYSSGQPLDIDDVPAGTVGLFAGSHENVPISGFAWITTQKTYSGMATIQQAWSYSIGSSPQGRAFFRERSNDGFWGDWREHIHTGNILSATGQNSRFPMTQKAVTDALNLKANTSTQVIAGTGLTGGGTLEANRILSVTYGTTAGTAAQGNDSRIVNATPNSRQIIAGTGLTGGGDLTANRTLSVTYGTTAGTAAQGNDPRLSDSREWTASVVSQAEAEAGTATTARKWTAQRVRQAIVAWWNSATSVWGRSFVSSADASEGRTSLGLGTAATRNVGTAASNVMEVGSFGLGGQGATYNYSNNSENSLGGGFFVDGNYSTIVSRRSNQTGVEFSGEYTGDKFYARRFRVNDGGWQPRVELHHTGNILTTTGQNSQFPMTQKAVTDALANKKDDSWQPTNASKTQALSGVTNAFVSGSSYHNIISWNAINATTSTLTLNLDVSLNHDITVEGDFTVVAPTNADPGKTGDIVLRVTGGDRIVSWTSRWKFLGSVPDIGEEDSMWVVSYKVLSPTEILASASKVV